MVFPSARVCIYVGREDVNNIAFCLKAGSL
jgi:hypothetical protein